MEEGLDSILRTIKKMIGLPLKDFGQFDLDLIVHINAAFNTLTQLGVGPVEGFTITGLDEVWDDFATDQRLDMIKSYIYMKVRLAFDPPSSSTVIEAFNKQIAEFEWRLNVAVDPSENNVLTPEVQNE